LAKIDITLPIKLIVGFVDKLGDPDDSEMYLFYLFIRLYDLLKPTHNIEIQYYYMGHGTFILGKDMSYMQDVFRMIEGK